MSDQEIENMLIGTVVPFLIAVVVQTGWSARTKQIVAGVVYVAVSLFVFAFRHEGAWGATDWRDWLRILFPVVVGAVVAYHGLWRKTVIPRIERATSAPRFK